MSERIFNVSRSTKTGKTVNVGDFPTVEQAQAAMLSHYMERTNKLNQLRQFNKPWEYDCCDIAEKLVELSNLPDDGQLKSELIDALYYLKAVAENPYNSDYHRVLFNVLLVITGFECF